MVLWADVVGYIGGAILAGCILPQLLQLWRTKSSKVRARARLARVEYLGLRLCTRAVRVRYRALLSR